MNGSIPDEAARTQGGQIFADRLNILLVQETRTFPEILSAWQAHEECETAQAFLKKTGLDKVISAEEFRAIELGTKIPTERLARIMAMHLPGGILRGGEPPSSLPQLYGFQGSAKYWRQRKGNEGKPISDVSDEVFTSFSVRVLDSLLRKQQALSSAPAQDAEEPKLSAAPPLPAAPDMRSKILAALREAFSRTRDEADTITDEEIEERLAAQYHQDSEKTVQGLKVLLSHNGADYTERELTDYLKGLSSNQQISQGQISQGRQIPPAAEALRFLRQSRGMFQEELALKLAVSRNVLKQWELGVRPFPDKYFERLVKMLRLSDREAELLILLRHPDILKDISSAWLSEKIAKKNWEHINFPALDEAWLAQQPQKKQAGLLLAAYRERQGMTLEELAKKIRVHRSTLGDLETGFRQISITSLGSLANHLSLSNKEAERFILLRHPDILNGVGIEWLRKKITDKKWEHINFPALDEAWLAQQPPKKQAGLLLAAYRERKGMTLEELVGQLKLTKSTLYLWESGNGQIPIMYLGSLTQHLSLSDEEAERFILLRNPDIIEKVGIDWLKGKIAEKNWEHINFPALDEEWLAQQDQYKRAGLLLAAYRERKGMAQKELAEVINVSSDFVYNLEKGRANIPSPRINEIVNALELTDAEKERLARTIEISCTAISRIKKTKRRLASAPTPTFAERTGQRSIEPGSPDLEREDHGRGE